MVKRQKLEVKLAPVAPGNSLPCVAYFPSGRQGGADGSSFEVYHKPSSAASSMAATVHMVVARKVSIYVFNSAQAPLKLYRQGFLKVALFLRRAALVPSPT